MKTLKHFVILDSDTETVEAWRTSIQDFCKAQAVQLEELSTDQALQTNGDFYALVSGGDGSLNFAARFIKQNNLENRAVLLYHPSGTGNDFSRAVGLHKFQMIEVCSLITEGKQSSLDLAQFEDSYFVNMASCGVFAEVTPETDDDSKALLGGFSYYIEGLKKVLDLEDFSCSFLVDGQKQDYTNVLGFFIGNSRFCGAGVQVTPNAEIDDGYLDLFIVKNAPRAELFQLALELQKEQIDLSGYDVYTKKAKKIEYESSRTLSITLDGESLQAQKAIVTVYPNELSIVIPQEL